MTPERDKNYELPEQAASSNDCTGIQPNPVDGLGKKALDELMSIYIDPPVTDARATGPACPQRPDENERPCGAHNPRTTTPASRPAK